MNHHRHAGNRHPGSTRNIALVGHSGAGKTTLAERLLAHSGVISKAGRVEDGNTVCDFEAEEKAHGHSLYPAVATLRHDGLLVHLIDTPGFPDFLGQTLSILPATETVAVVVAADKGIETTTRRILNVAAQRRLPRMIVVNRIDEHVGDCEPLLARLRETFGSEVLPINLPTADGSGVVDLWESESGDVAFGSAKEAHQRIVDQTVEVDEELMAEYLEQGTVSPEALRAAFQKALREGHLVPVCFTSAKTGAGIAELLAVFEHLCPSPLEGNPRPFAVVGEDGSETPYVCEPDPAKSLVGHVFKVTSDPFVGKLCLVRIHQGTLKAGDSIRINDGTKAIRIAHLHEVHGKEHHEVHEAVPGDIVAIAKIDELHFNDVIHAGPELGGLRFKSIEMPRPMYGLAIEAKSRNDEAKISTSLAKLCEEDPAFIVERVAATHETVARAMGELHMRVALERLKNRFKLELDTHPPKVAYKETIGAAAEGHHRHKKQTGGAGQFGEVFLRVEPIVGDGGGFEFVDATVGGSVPRQFLPAIEKGVRQVLADGAIAGYPLGGVRVEVCDGKHHPVDSKEVAFVTAGRRAFIDAVLKAKPLLLEPIVEVEVTAPSASMGDLTSDFSGRRGHVLDTEILPGEQCLIRAEVPLSEMGTYSSTLKSMTAGQGSFVMDYRRDAPAPPNVQAQVVASFTRKEEED
jgi:elongation factor G